jgi:hypothetical protein
MTNDKATGSPDIIDPIESAPLHSIALIMDGSKIGLPQKGYED